MSQVFLRLDLAAEPPPSARAQNLLISSGTVLGLLPNAFKRNMLSLPKPSWASFLR